MGSFLLAGATPWWSLRAVWACARCTRRGAAVDAGLDAAARTRRAVRAVKGDVVSVWQVLYETPSAPPIPAQRIARFDDHCTRNCLLQNKLRQRYSRSIARRTINTHNRPLPCFVRDDLALRIDQPTKCLRLHAQEHVLIRA